MKATFKDFVDVSLPCCSEFGIHMFKCELFICDKINILLLPITSSENIFVWPG